MRHRTLFLAVAAIVLATGGTGIAYGQGVGPGPGYGMGPGMMQGYGPGWGGGPGMMQGWGQGEGYGGYGMGPGMMGLGMMGPGMMRGYGRGWGMGPGMMRGYGPGWGPGWGMGPGMMPGYGPGMMGGTIDRNLSVNDVRTNLERWLEWRGNPRLKIGEVKEQNKDTIVATIVTKKENALVDEFKIDRHTGWVQRVD